MNDLRYTVTSQEGDRTVVHLKGELDAYSAPRLRNALFGLVGDRAELVIDLGDLAFLDSSGLSAFIALHKRLTTTGGRLVLDRRPEFVERILTITGLNHIFGAGAPGPG